MIIKNYKVTKRIHHSIEVDGYIVYRNEELEYDKISDSYKRISMNWSIGDKNGHGPYISIEDHNKNKSFTYKSSIELERDFQLQLILSKELC